MAKSYKYSAKRSHPPSSKAHADSDNVSSSASMTPPSQMKFENIQRQTPEGENLQMKHTPFQFKQEEEEKVQMKTAPFQLQEKEEEQIQMKPALGAPPHVQDYGCSSCAGGTESVVQQKKETENNLHAEEEIVAHVSEGTRTKMPQDIQMKMEAALGSDFSNVNIYINSEKASQIGALAYTQGSDIYFAKGQYAPQSSKGQELLGHELTHIVQQREGKVQPTTQVKGMPVNDSNSLEQEADVMGRKAANTKADQAAPTTQRKKKGNTSGDVVQGGFF